MMNERQENNENKYTRKRLCVALNNNNNKNNNENNKNIKNI